MKNIKKWVKCAGIRAIREMATLCLSMISIKSLMSEIDWQIVGSAVVLAGIISILTSIVNLPEAKGDSDTKK